MVLFRQVGPWLGMWRNFGTPLALATIFGVTAVFAALATLWRRADYRYGAEWMLRVPESAAKRISGRF